MYESEDYKAGYSNGLTYGHARLNKDYKEMDYSRKKEYERGVRDGKIERWRKEEGYYGYWI